MLLFSRRRRAAGRPRGRFCFFSASLDGASRVGQPMMCCSAISASAAIQAGDSFRQGM
jgi:hypothetical protein